MNKEHIDYVLSYIEDQGLPVQITYNGRGDYTVDLQNEIHTQVLLEMMVDKGFEVSIVHMPHPRPYYTRIQ